MTVTASESRTTFDAELERLLASSEQLSFDPAVDVDWDAPIDPNLHGCSPEWSTLYGTELWDRMTPEQRVTLTRHEAGSVASIGIWFEMLLQKMILKDQYGANPATPEFQFALTEIADECRHSIMFARACQKLGIDHYRPNPFIFHGAKFLDFLSRDEVAYASILVAEEVLDVMQRDWMRSEEVLPLVRQVSRIHVIEEARHMKFARLEVIDRMRDAGPIRRRTSALMIALVAHDIVISMVRPGVYKAAGLDVKEAKAVAAANEHHQNLLRLSCVPLMDFLSEAGLLTKPALALYRRVHMV